MPCVISWLEMEQGSESWGLKASQGFSAEDHTLCWDTLCLPSCVTDGLSAESHMTEVSQPDPFVSWVPFSVMFILSKNFWLCRFFSIVCLLLISLIFCFKKFLISLGFICSFSGSLRKKKDISGMEVYFYWFIYLAASGFHCCTWAFPTCAKWGPALPCSAWASHCCDFSCCGARALGAWASVVAACRLSSCVTQASVVAAREPSSSVACGLFLDQGSNPCPLHWQADS